MNVELFIQSVRFPEGLETAPWAGGFPTPDPFADLSILCPRVVVAQDDR
jgi:hypothetical protein